MSKLPLVSRAATRHSQPSSSTVVVSSSLLKLTTTRWAYQLILPAPDHHRSHSQSSAAGHPRSGMRRRKAEQAFLLFSLRLHPPTRMHTNSQSPNRGSNDARQGRIAPTASRKVNLASLTRLLLAAFPCLFVVLGAFSDFHQGRQLFCHIGSFAFAFQHVGRSLPWTLFSS